MWEKKKKEAIFYKTVYLISISSLQVNIFYYLLSLFFYLNYWNQQKFSIEKIFIKWHLNIFLFPTVQNLLMAVNLSLITNITF